MGILRLLLALVVVLGHAGFANRMHGFTGPTAVETFFIISGFYMALVLNEKYIPNGQSVTSVYKTFIQARLLRLYPVYLVVLLITVSLQHWAHFSHIANPATLFALVLTSLTLFGQDVVMFLGINPSSGGLFFTSDFNKVSIPCYWFLIIPQAWSLGVELWFYLLAPLFIRKGVAVMVVLALLSLAIRISIHHIGLTNDPWTYRFFPSEVMFFLLGACGYYAYRSNRDKAPIKARKGYFGIAIIMFGWFLYMHPFVKLIYFAYFGFIAFAIPTLFQLTKNVLWERWIGELSYPLYICHEIVIQGLRRIHQTNGLIVCLCSVTFAIVLLVCVDQPFEKARQAWIAKKSREA